MYSIKEIFHTIQGEGAQSGRTAVFCRFAGCNLWSGREQDRAQAQCQFCDTDFVGTDGTDGGTFQTAPELVKAIANVWGSGTDNRFVVLTGGEPMLQVDTPLINALHEHDFTIAIETNGTLKVPDSIDWICVSPKAGAPLIQTTGDELKLVYPQPELTPGSVAALPFKNRFLQPMDGPQLAKNTHATIDYIKRNPQWRLSVQTHKILGIR